MSISLNENENEYVDGNEGNIACPVCENLYHLTDLMIHVMNEHQQFLVVWASLQVPSTRPSDVYSDQYYTDIDIDDRSYRYEQTVDRAEIEEDIPELISDYSDDDGYVYETYELLSRICEIIGDHVVRMSKEEVNEYAPIVSFDAICDNQIHKCPVCLETFDRDRDSNTRYRRVNACQHVFCAECLETWLSRKRTCPLCRSHVVDDRII